MKRTFMLHKNTYCTGWRLLLSSVLLMALTIAKLQAQTVIISPTGDGGFENGTTFAANGWTLINNASATANNWALNTGAPAGFSGTRAAYITNNLVPAVPPSAYTNTAASTVHFYRDVTFPAGETTINLSFSKILTGETSWDRILVYISNAAPTGTPVAGTPASNTTTLTGYTLLSTVATSTTWTTVNVPITGTQAGNTTVASSRRILIVWQNDGSGGTPPAAIDNISLTSVCTSPVVGLAASPIGLTTATYNWTTVTGATSYNVRYKKVSDPVTVSTWTTPVNTTTNSLPVTGLTTNTAYEFQVSAVGASCALYSASANFTTLCSIVSTFPYLEDFTAAMPTCWLASEGAPGASAHFVTTTADATHGVAGPKTGTHFMYLDVYNAQTAYNPYYLTTPAFTLPATPPKELSYYYYLGTGGYKGTTGATGTDPFPLAIQISSNGGATWTDLFGHTNTNSVFGTSSSATAWTKKTISLSAYAGQTVLFRFRATSNYGSGFCNLDIDQFKIDNPCAPAILTTIPATRCGQGTATISITTAPTAVVKWYAAATTGITPIFTGNPFTTPVLTASTTYYVTATDTAADCESPTRTAVTVTVNTPPAVVAASPQAPGVCTGTGVTINATSANTNYTYSWSTGQTTASFTLTPTASTTYVVTASDAVSGCVAKDSIRVNVNTQPPAPIISPASPSICLGSSVVLTDITNPALAVGTLGTGALNNSTTGYPTPFGNYYGGDHEQYLIRASELTAVGFTAGTINKLAFNLFTGYTYAALKDYTVKMAQTSLTVMTTSFASTGFTTVYTNPSYTPPATAGLAPINFTTNFNWDGISNIIVDVSFLNCTTCNGTATCATTYTNNGRVTQSTTAFVSTYAVYADDNCTVPSFAPSGSTNAYTYSQRPDIQFTFQKFAVNWTPVAGLYKNAALTQALTAADSISVVYASPAATASYTAKATIQGCSSVPSNTATVTVLPLPPTTITAGGPLAFCIGGSVVLNAPAGANLTYVWNKGGTPIVPAVTTASYTATTAGAYTVTVTNTTTGCTATTATASTVVLNPLPATTITPSGSTTFCAGGSVTLTAPAAPTGTTYSYVWYDNGAPITPAQTAQTLVVTTARTVTVKVTNNTTGCTATTPTATVTTVGLPPAVISPASSTTICQGTTVRLRTNNSFGLTYQWSLGGTAITGAIDSFYNAGVAGNYTVAITAGTGCTATSAAVAVTVNTLPTATITASSAPVTFCAGGSVVLTANIGTGLSYQWQNGAASVVPANTTTSYTATTTGNYAVIVTNTATLCTNLSNVIAVTANPLPTATITPASTTTICAGSTVVLNANTGTGLTYKWFNGAAQITGATSASYTANAVGSYTVQVTNANTCSAVSLPVTVNVNPLPPTAVTPAGAVSICSGTSITLAGPTATGLTYQWKLGAANATGTSTTSSYTATAAGSYTLVVTALGCTATSPATVVSILPLPVVAMTPTAATTACDSVVLSSSSTGVTYQWNLNNAPIVGATDNIYTAIVSGNYSLTVTSTANGCTAKTAATAITINPSPVGIITYSSPIVFCEGGAVVLNTYGGNNQTYEWRESTIPIAGANTANYITTTSGNYTVKVTNSVTGCTRVSSGISVHVNPLPVPVITYNAAFNQLSTTQPYSLYQWYVNTQPIGGATSRLYTPTSNGAYAVAVTDSNGCVNVSGITFVNSVGIANTQAGLKVKVYPNPTTGVLHIDAPIKVNMVVRDITGKSVIQVTDQHEINVENLADGMYLLYISNAEGQLIKAEKITKQSN